VIPPRHQRLQRTNISKARRCKVVVASLPGRRRLGRASPRPQRLFRKRGVRLAGRPLPKWPLPRITPCWKLRWKVGLRAQRLHVPRSRTALSLYTFSAAKGVGAGARAGIAERAPTITPVTATLGRRGARHPSLVPPNVLRELEAGGESANHMEQIALDMGALLCHAFPELTGHADRLRGSGLVARMRIGGSILWESLGIGGVRAALSSSSDTVRGWGAMAVGQEAGLPLVEALRSIRPFANDRHFAVREWAWLSVREHVQVELDAALALLGTWASEPDANLRRFATEVTRPRGVWCSHIRPLREAPWRGLSIIDSLRADPSRYVQTSVANWLNDASKDQPTWVTHLCAAWRSDSPTAATEWICKRAERTMRRS
jgi:3-methyladenine DNA glycosylase AlkC